MVVVMMMVVVVKLCTPIHWTFLFWMRTSWVWAFGDRAQFEAGHGSGIDYGVIGTNLRPCERSDRALYVPCLFANPLYLSSITSPNKVDFDVDGQRKTSKGNSNLSITAQGIMHRASRPEPIGTNNMVVIQRVRQPFLITNPPEYSNSLAPVPLCGAVPHKVPAAGVGMLIWQG